MYNILCIDPSIRAIGFAILQVENKKIQKILDTTYYADATDSILYICDEAYRALANFTNSFDMSQIVIEMPQFQLGPKGIIAAQKGYTLNLALITGFLLGRCELSSFNSFLYTPIQWKGNRPKTATQAAFRRMFPKWEYNSEHSCDSIMLGVHHLKQKKLIN